MKQLFVLVSVIGMISLSSCGRTVPPEPTNERTSFPIEEGRTVPLEPTDERTSFPIEEITQPFEQNPNHHSSQKNDFVMNLFSDKAVYQTSEPIQIWADLSYVGDNDTVSIFSGSPYMSFVITDEKDFTIGGLVHEIFMETVLTKDVVYHFDYEKNLDWDADAPDASFWENFANEEELFLPAGEYKIILTGAFTLDDAVPSELHCELNIVVEYSE